MHFWTGLPRTSARLDASPRFSGSVCLIECCAAVRATQVGYEFVWPVLPCLGNVPRTFPSFCLSATSIVISDAWKRLHCVTLVWTALRTGGRWSPPLKDRLGPAALTLPTLCEHHIIAHPPFRYIPRRPASLSTVRPRRKKPPSKIDYQGFTSYSHCCLLSTTPTLDQRSILRASHIIACHEQLKSP